MPARRERPDPRAEGVLQLARRPRGRHRGIHPLAPRDQCGVPAGDLVKCVIVLPSPLGDNRADSCDSRYWGLSRAPASSAGRSWSSGTATISTSTAFCPRGPVRCRVPRSWLRPRPAGSPPPPKPRARLPPVTHGGLPAGRWDKTRLARVMVWSRCARRPAVRAARGRRPVPLSWLAGPHRLRVRWQCSPCTSREPRRPLSSRARRKRALPATARSTPRSTPPRWHWHTGQRHAVPRASLSAQRQPRPRFTCPLCPIGTFLVSDLDRPFCHP